MAKASSAKASSAKASPKVADTADVEIPEENTEVEADEDSSDEDMDMDADDDDIEAVLVEYINPEIGLTTREFSKAIHGKAFKALSKMFAEKFKGTIL